MSIKILLACGLLIASTRSATAMKTLPTSRSNHIKKETAFLTKNPQQLAQSILKNDHECKALLNLKATAYSEDERITFLAKLLRNDLEQKGKRLEEIVDGDGNNVLHALLMQEILPGQEESAVKIVLRAAGDCESIEAASKQNNVQALLTKQDSHGNTALHKAIWSLFNECHIIKVLLALPCSKNVLFMQNEDGLTILHTAVIKNSYQIVWSILQALEDDTDRKKLATLTSMHGFTALDLAQVHDEKNKNSRAIVSLLKKYQE